LSGVKWARFVFVLMKKDVTEPTYKIAPCYKDMPRSLFGHLSETVGELTESHRKVAQVLEVLRVEDHVREHRRFRGRSKKSRKGIARALVAKAVLGIPTTKHLIERLKVDRTLSKICGFLDGLVPSESVFSRAFGVLAEKSLLNEVHQFLVQIHFSDVVVLNAAIDATAIHAREEPVAKPKKERKAKKKRGRKKKGEYVEPKGPTRQETQLEQSWDISLAELPNVCDIGAKRNSKGHDEHWIGYKLHVSVSEGGVPLAVCLTSASVHDSQVAIPLIQMVHARVLACCYHLMDKAYIGQPIKKMAGSLGQVAIVQGKTAPGETESKPLANWLKTAEERRLEGRTVVERFNSDLKDNHGGNSVRVKGWKKVQTHLMFGVLAIFAFAILRLQN
jgi:hypothetical protein